MEYSHLAFVVRPLSIDLSTTLYHVRLGSALANTVYANTRSFIAQLEAVSIKLGWHCYACCMMANEICLVVETRQANLSRGINSLYRSNPSTETITVETVGSRNNWRIVFIDKARFLVEVVREICWHPDRGYNLGAPEAWQWEDKHAWYTRDSSKTWLNLERLLRYFAGQPGLARTRFIGFLGRGRHRPSIWNYLRFGLFLGDEDFVSQTIARLHRPSQTTGLASPELRRPWSYYQTHYSDQGAIRAAYASGEYTLKQIAEHFGIHFSEVSRVLNA